MPNCYLWRSVVVAGGVERVLMKRTTFFFLGNFLKSESLKLTRAMCLRVTLDRRGSAVWLQVHVHRLAGARALVRRSRQGPSLFFFSYSFESFFSLPPNFFFPGLFV